MFKILLNQASASPVSVYLLGSRILKPIYGCIVKECGDDQYLLHGYF